CADLQTIFRSAGGAFYSVQIRCQAPRRSFVSNPFRDRTAAANNLPERFTTPWERIRKSLIFKHLLFVVAGSGAHYR
uniref:hypothetical protein n=1 Tax=Pseudomonas aeruginosa TaxID=287 RepID=UPI001B830FAD